MKRASVSVTILWRYCVEFIILLSGISVFANGLHAERILESPRSFGEGGVYVSQYDSEDTTKANPAALSDNDKLTFQLRLLDGSIYYGKNTQDAVSELVNTLSNSSSSTGLEILEIVANRFGKMHYARVQSMPIAMRIFSFEIAPFFASSNYIDPRIPSILSIELESNTYFGMVMALGLKFGKNFQWGLSVKPFFRQRFYGEMLASDLIDFVSYDNLALDDVLDSQNAMQIAVDSGVTYTAGKATRLSLLIENIGYAGNLSETDDSPPPIPTILGLGINHRIIFGKSWNWDLTGEFQDLLNPEEKDFIQLLHLGTEFGTDYFTHDNDIGIQAGVLDGYFSLGFFVDLFLARLEYANYAVELGKRPGQRYDRRSVIKLSSSMTF